MNAPFTPSDIGWLLGGRCELSASGQLEWVDENRNYTARLPLEAIGFGPEDDLAFVYRIGKKRASEPTLLIRFRGHCAYRLDVNGTHREGTKLYQFVSHIQRRRSSEDPAETFEPNPLGVPPITIGQRVTPAEYRSLLNGFAAPIGMDTLDIEWTDPPEGRQP